MRILLIANKLPYPAKDGGSIATLNLAKSLAMLGHEVTLLAMNTSKHFTDPAAIPRELKAVISFICIPVDTDIKIRRLIRNFFFSKWPYNAERFISKEFEQALVNLLDKEKFDIIQFEGLYLAPYLDTIRSYSKAKVVMRAHNIEHEIWERTITQQAGIRKFYLHHLACRIRRMELQYLNHYDAIVPITSRDEEKLRKLGCRLPGHVLPMGIDAVDLVPDTNRLEFPSLFHIGALDWMPNQEGLLWFFENVWGRILQKHPDLKFYLAGRNAPQKFISLPYPNIQFMGEVDDAYQFITSKAVMIVPVFSGSGMRVKIVEGMALGKAIVTTSIGTEGIGTTHGENIFIADNPEDFASNVCALVENRELCMFTGRKARKFISENYDNHAITSSLAAFYENLLK
jgi:glycosyltransferase involved in cell wall biosynthesis